MQEEEKEKVRQVIRTFLSLYNKKRAWIDDHTIAFEVTHPHVDEQFVRAVMAVLAWFDLVETGQHGDRLVYALPPVSELRELVLRGSLLRPFEALEHNLG